MTVGQWRGLLFALGTVAALWLTQTAVAAGEAQPEEEMLGAVEGLRNGTLAPEDVNTACLASISASGDEHSYREVMAPFLEVPDDKAVPALCQALVRAISAETVSEETLRQILNPRDKDAEALEVGRLMRAVYFSHRRSATSENMSGSAQ